MKYECITSLEAYLKEVEARLLSTEERMRVSYLSAPVSPWDGDALAATNKPLLAKASGGANLYAIFTSRQSGNEHSLRYIGKTTKKLARQRISNHLFRKNEKTGSKLAQVVAHAGTGGTVEIAWVSVEPESLRNYLEEELILRHREADWNRENRAAIKASLAAPASASAA